SFPSSSLTATASLDIYTLSLHDALPISTLRTKPALPAIIATLSSTLLRVLCGRRSILPITRSWTFWACNSSRSRTKKVSKRRMRSEEHTSELQSRENLVCRLLLEKKKQK